MDEKIKEFKEEIEKYRSSGSFLGPGSVTALQLREGNILEEAVYTIEESVSPSRDVIIPFYLPETVRNIAYVKMNLYFPGLQVGDYPFNTQTLYIGPVSKGTIEYHNGSFALLRDDYSLYSGNGVSGGNYIWYRGYFRFQVAPIHGFKLTSCDLYWTLGDRKSVGSGGNTQQPNKLHAINDYAILDKNDWLLTTQVDYGNVNIYTDTIGNAYSKDVKTRIQALIDALTDYACFRYLGAEHTDVSNANNYHLNEPQLKCVLEEDTDAPVYLHAEQKEAWTQLDYYKSAVEDKDLLRFFSGTGKKRIKFSCDKIRRVNIILRVGLRKA